MSSLELKHAKVKYVDRQQWKDFVNDTKSVIPSIILMGNNERMDSNIAVRGATANPVGVQLMNDTSF